MTARYSYNATHDGYSTVPIIAEEPTKTLCLEVPTNISSMPCINNFNFFYDSIMLDNNPEMFPIVLYPNRFMAFSKQLWDYLIANNSSFSVLSNYSDVFIQEAETLKVDYWDKNYRKTYNSQRYTSSASDMSVHPFTKKDNLYVLSTVLSILTASSVNTYSRAWPFIFLSDERQLSSDYDFLCQVIAEVDILDRPMFVFVHAPAFYGQVIPGVSAWTTLIRSRSEWAYDHYEDMIAAPNKIINLNLTMFIARVMTQLLKYPTTEYTTCAQTDATDLAHVPSITVNIAKITDWTNVRMVKIILLRVDAIAEIIDMRTQCLDLFNETSPTIDDWTQEQIDYFAENTIVFPFDYMLTKVQFELIYQLFVKCDLKFLPNMIYRYHGIAKAYLGINVDALNYPIDAITTNRDKATALNSLMERFIPFDIDRKWRDGAVTSRSSDFDLFWSVGGLLFNSNTTYVSQYISKRTMIAERTSKNKNNLITNVLGMRGVWYQNDVNILNKMEITLVYLEMTQNNYGYVKSYLDTFDDPFIRALALLLFVSRNSTSQNVFYMFMAINDYIRDYGYHYVNVSFEKTINNSWSEKYKFTGNPTDLRMNTVYYIEALDGTKTYYKDGAVWKGDYMTAQVFTYILTIMDSNEEWRAAAGLPVEDFYTIYTFNPNWTNAKIYLQQRVIYYDNAKENATTKIANFVESFNYVESKPLMVRATTEQALVNTLTRLDVGTMVITETRFNGVDCWSAPIYMIGMVSVDGSYDNNILPLFDYSYGSYDGQSWFSLKDLKLNKIDPVEAGFDYNAMTTREYPKDGDYFQVTQKVNVIIGGKYTKVQAGQYLLYLFKDWKIVKNTVINSDSLTDWPMIIDEKCALHTGIWVYKDYSHGATNLNLSSRNVSQLRQLADEFRLIETVEQPVYCTQEASPFYKPPTGTRGIVTRDVPKTSLGSDPYSKVEWAGRNRGTDPIITMIAELRGTRGKSHYEDHQLHVTEALKKQPKTRAVPTTFEGRMLNDNITPACSTLCAKFGIAETCKDPRMLRMIQRTLDIIEIKRRSKYKDPLKQAIVNRMAYHMITGKGEPPKFPNKIIKAHHRGVLDPDVTSLVLTDEELAELMKYYDKADDFDELVDHDAVKDFAGLTEAIAENSRMIYTNTLEFLAMPESSTEASFTISNTNEMTIKLPYTRIISHFSEDEDQASYDITIPGSEKTTDGEYAFDITCELYKVLLADSLDVSNQLALVVYSSNAMFPIPGSLEIQLPNTALTIGCIKMSCLRDYWYYSWYGFMKIYQITLQEINFMSKYDLYMALLVCIDQGSAKMPYEKIFETTMNAGADNMIQMLVNTGMIPNFITSAQKYFNPQDNSRINLEGDTSCFPTFMKLTDTVLNLRKEFQKDPLVNYVHKDESTYVPTLGTERARYTKGEACFLLCPSSSYMSRSYPQQSGVSYILSTEKSSQEFNYNMALGMLQYPNLVSIAR